MSRIDISDRRIFIAIGLACAAIALVMARPYAGGWNDGSRLATVECLVDHGTLAIDRSIFVDVPQNGPSPYPRDEPLLQQYGTRDKLFIDGRFYSDKSPVPAYYLAAIYATARTLGMPSAAERPDLFCRLMTWVSSGLAYVVAVLCLFSIARRIGLDPRWSAALTLFFALGTVALPYAEQVNNHILLLAVAMMAFRVLLIAKAEGWTTGRLIAAGCLAGVGYTIDLGAGPPFCLLICIGALFLSPQRKPENWIGRIAVILAALPWVAFHHIVNYQLGGSLSPANANPAFFNWPGSPFNEQNMTGAWRHANVFKAALYAMDMLFGKRGFLGHNLLLFLPVLAIPKLVCNGYRERLVVITGILWAIATWLLYAATSNNQSGACCSVRWFVPLLGPGFVAICILLRDHPRLRRGAVILGVGGTALGIGMAIRGPWFPKLVPFYWIIYPGTIVMWFATLRRTRPVPICDALRVENTGVPDRKEAPSLALPAQVNGPT